MGFEELQSTYYIHNGYLIIDEEAAYRVDTIREVYFKGSFLFVTFKDSCSFIHFMFGSVDSDTIDFFQGLNREIQSSSSRVSLDVVWFSVLLIITLGLVFWGLTL
jgi:hypothetical protein